MTTVRHTATTSIRLVMFALVRAGSLICFRSGTCTNRCVTHLQQAYVAQGFCNDSPTLRRSWILKLFEYGLPQPVSQQTEATPGRTTISLAQAPQRVAMGAIFSCLSNICASIASCIQGAINAVAGCLSGMRCSLRGSQHVQG